MASNSKKRRRVLRVSCILAALIIAGSSFAWFTSKDEVTNRLTASSDYGVSIVESFTPPKNWLPGSEVNKDVYAVNTGNIDAFVNEDVTGVLNYTYERLAGEPNTTTGVKLNEKEIDDIAMSGVTTYEAASYLAWTNAAGETLGDKIIKADGSGWKPTAEGVYIFRRSITHDMAQDGDHPSNDAFAYSGYYFKDGNYYKIVIGDDNFPYAEGTKHVFDILSRSLGEGVEVDEKGTVTSGTPTVRYVTLGKVEDKAVTFLYEDAKGTGVGNTAENHPARLVVTDTPDAVTTDTTSGNSYNASANAARAEIEYLNALKLSNDATNAYNQAKTDFDYANALITARNALVDAAKARYNANDSASTATTTSQNSIAAYTDKATAIAGATSSYGKVYAQAATDDIGKYTLVPDSISSDDSLRAAIAALADANSQVKKNLTEFDELYDAMYGTGGTASQITAKLTAIATTKTGDAANSVAETQEAAQELAELVALVDTMNQQLTDYEATYANLKTSAEAAHAGTGITATQETAALNAINGVKTQLSNLKNALITGDESLKALIAKAKTDATAMENAVADNGTAATTWSTAVSNYNTAVTNASNDYTTALNTLKITQPDGTTVLQLTDNRSTLNSTYSANGSTGTFASEPAFNTIYDGTSKANNPDKGYPVVKLDALTDETFPTTAPTLKTLRETMNSTVATTNGKKTAYEQALNALKDDSSIIIYVNLANGYDTAWQFDPSTSGTTTASFYLKSILEAGTNSAQLIDSIYLDDSVTAAAYKDMSFDLNVLLDSAQVTYADDQTTITDAAVKTNDKFGLKVKADGINQSTKEVTWDLPTT